MEYEIRREETLINKILIEGLQHSSLRIFFFFFLRIQMEYEMYNSRIFN